MKVSIDLPEDVVDILLSISKLHGRKQAAEDAITQLARGYSAMMDDAMLPQSDDGVVAEPHNSFNMDAGPVNTSFHVPSQEEVNKFLEQHTQPAASLEEVIVSKRNAPPPRASDGLVPADYILVSGLPQAVLDMLSDEKNRDNTILAIRQVLSTIPEDTWTGSNVEKMVEAQIRKNKSGA